MADSNIEETELIEGTVLNERGEKVAKKFSKGKFLGKGGFAKCYEFLDLVTGKLIAAKVIDKATLSKGRAKQKLASEIDIHKSLHHPGIVRFEGHFEDSANVYLLLELCPNQSLKELVKRRKKLTELEVQCFLSQLIPILMHLHGMRIIHRDLKLGNLFLGRHMELKLGDFGLAAKLSAFEERRKTICGTPNYIAPEILDVKLGTRQNGYSFEVDVWAVGIIAYTMLVGKPPFETANVKQTYAKIRANDYTLPEDAGVSSEAASFIRRLLVPGPESRPKLADLLLDSFLTKNPVPRTLPVATLSCPPTQDFILHYSSGARPLHEIHSASSFERTAPSGSHATSKKGRALNQPSKVKLKRNNFMVTSSQALKVASSQQSRPMSKGASERSLKPFAIKTNIVSHNNLRPGTSAAGTPSMGRLRDAEPLVYIELYLDYTSRYGIGYILTNGALGFYYNDMTNLLLLEHKGQYAYSDFYVRKDKKVDSVTCYSTTEYPKELSKKVKIFMHFKQWHSAHQKQLHLQLSEKQEEEPGSYAIKTESHVEAGVKKVVKTNNGILFKLSNNLVQMCFTDKSQMVVCFKRKLLISINKKGEKESYTVSNQLFQTASEAVIQRFKYTLHLVSSINSTRSARRHMPATFHVLRAPVPQPT